MQKIDRRTAMVELESMDDVSEGQFADYLAAEESGDYGDWGQGMVEYQCKSCGVGMAIASDQLADYDALIRNWHTKTNDGDYFSKYVFEYLAFMALLKSHIAMSSGSERRAIQTLKRDDQIRKIYLDIFAKNTELQSVLPSLIKELEFRPLLNSSYDYDNAEIDVWWNSSGDHPNEDSDGKKGVIHSSDDWENIVEYWCAVRNNLFHGGKDPGIKRDQFLVEHAFRTLNPLMNALIPQ